jgi:hypothetical protein
MASGMLWNCSGEAPLGPPTSGRALNDAGAIPNIGGSWNWSSVVKLTVPDFVAQMFGIPVEGPITHLECESSGTMVLIQLGSSFTGSVQRTLITCETKGGFVFVPPPAFSPLAFNVEDGTIQGRSIHFTFGGAPLPTPCQGVIVEIEAGVATALKATGRTIVPGHPQSPLPLGPPPAGTSKTISWEAVRP